MTERKILELLRVRYEPAEWVILPNVQIRAGNRFVDALGVNLWSSRGFTIVGFEFKVNRSDWLRELKDAAKAEETSAYCDRWFVVAPRDVVHKDELPVGWGYIEVRGEKLFELVHATLRNDVKPVNRALLSALLRRARDGSPDEVSRVEIENRVRAECRKQCDANESFEVSSLKRKITELEARTQMYERNVGNDWYQSHHETTLKAVGIVKELLAERSLGQVVADLADSLNLRINNATGLQRQLRDLAGKLTAEDSLTPSENSRSSLCSSGAPGLECDEKEPRNVSHDPVAADAS